MNSFICECNSIRKKKYFFDWDDFYNFLKEINKNELFINIKVDQYIYNIGEEEFWYKCIQCKKIYRLVKPDPPFEGLWEIVDEKEDTIYRND